MFDFFGWKKEVEEIRKALDRTRGDRDVWRSEAEILRHQLTETKGLLDLHAKKTQEVKSQKESLQERLDETEAKLRTIADCLAKQLVLRQRMENQAKKTLETIADFPVPSHIQEITIP